MKKILITGAGGYIGTALVPSILKSKKYKVIAVDRFFFGNFLNKNKNLKIIYEDIRNLPESLFKGVYAVIDLAAISNDPSGEKFKKETYEINYKARVENAIKAKKNKVKKYLLPSSCSNYGRINKNLIADENFKLNPLTNYSKANSMAESKILNLANKNFCATVYRQGTLFGFSPRLRLDIAINGMTYGIFKNNTLPVMRDGEQRRPMLHIKDCIRAIKFFVDGDEKKFTGEVFNIGDMKNNYSINNLVKIYLKIFGKKIKIDWYGSPDKRSYYVSFKKINSLGFNALYDAEYGIKELLREFKSKKIQKSSLNITLDWYTELEKWNKIINSCSKNNIVIKNFKN